LTNVSGCIVVMAKDNSPIALNAHVLCSVTESNFGDWSAGFVQDSKKVNDDWYYSVAFPPSKNRFVSNGTCWKQVAFTWRRYESD
jgi:hypothetical protein